MNIFDGNYLFKTDFSPQDPRPSGYFLALTIAFLVLFLVAAFGWWRRAKLAPENPVLRKFIRRASKAGMYWAVIGLFLALMRYVQLDYLDMPFLLLLVILGMIATVGYFVYDLSERYPLAVHRLQESNLQRRFMPATGPKREPSRPDRPSGRQRGKRRR